MRYPAIFRSFCISVLFVSLLGLGVFAQETDETVDISKYQINMYIEYNKMLIESTMLFADPATTEFSIDLPYDARSIINEVDRFEHPAIIEGNRILFFLKKNEVVKYSYITEDLLDKDSFIASLKVPFDTKHMQINLALPEDAALAKPIREGSISGSSVFPKPKKLETDGQVITIVWEFKDVKKGDELDLYVKYKKPLKYLIPTIIIIMIIISVILVLTASVYLVYKRNRKNNGSGSDGNNNRTHHSRIDAHLKEDEQQIINILRLKEGSCEQGTLRIATGFSKAKLSGLLKEMEARKMIHKEKRGKKNLVFLKE